LSLFIMILRKIIKNKWLELSLLIGLIVTVALVSSMPIYTDAILERTLKKDLQAYQEQTNQYPGIYAVSGYYPENAASSIFKLDQLIEERGLAENSIPELHYSKERTTERMVIEPVDPLRQNPPDAEHADLSAVFGLEDNVDLVDGKFPSSEPVNGVFEVVVFEHALNHYETVVGTEYLIEDSKLTRPLQVKIVGAVKRSSSEDLFINASRMEAYKSTFLFSFDLFEREITMKESIRSAIWYIVSDYMKMDLNTADQLLQLNNQVQAQLKQQFDYSHTSFETQSTLWEYFNKEKSMKVMLWSLYVPVFVMLAFYLFMVSNLIVGRQKTEIAVLRSRGASRFQVMGMYIAEGLILGSIALLIGPFLGMWFTKVLGASNGFLEFIQRSAMEVGLNRKVYNYAILAVICSLIMTLIPAYMATRTTIVGHKQSMSRGNQISVWHKFYIDIILISTAFYGLYNYQKQTKSFQTLGVDASQFYIDPLLFVIPALFVIGMGLLILRIYPWTIRFIYWLGRRFWPPYLYSTLIQVGRSGAQYQFIMLFLILTISTGMFSASAARTLNQNNEERIQYANGADIVLETYWQDDDPIEFSPGAASAPSTDTEEISYKMVQYSEPPFQPLTKLPGVEHAAKVFVKNGAKANYAASTSNVQLIGIETDQFGQTAWFKNRLLPHHFNEYLNVMAADPTAVLISRTYAEAKGIEVGESIQLSWDTLNPRQFVVYGIVDYFPSFNPLPQAGKEGTDSVPMLVIGHLGYIQNNLALEPYEVWIKLKPDADREALYQAITDQGILVESLTDTRNELSKARKDPFQMAINGVMTLGFMISVLVTFLGFILYWVLTLYSRTLQLGILRAMGISLPQMVGMLVVEQLLTSGAGVLIGMFTGQLASKLFVPLFQLSFNPTTQVPPFEVIFHAQDIIQLFAIIVLMLVLGLFILATMVSRVKIHQAVKLGED
jgi:putative ABC transport system permease protein